MNVGSREIGPETEAYCIAEISANHNGSLAAALDLVRKASDCGADAVKIQTYTADTLTIDCDSEPFRIGAGTVWEGRNLHSLYQEAFTPWEWHEALFSEADKLGIQMFSTPFDDTAVDFLESFNPPVYKIASFELVHHELLRKIASTGRPVILSTGMATIGEIADAVEVLRTAGCKSLALLKCTSGYPAEPEEMNLRTIPHMAAVFDVPVGLSDHTLGVAVPVAAVALGACIVEKHFIESRSVEGPDSSFSLEPAEFRQMVESVKVVSRALGGVQFDVSPREASSRVFRRSLFFVENVEAGEMLTDKNVRCIRPGNGIAPKHLPQILGRRATSAISRGTPVSWDLVN